MGTITIRVRKVMVGVAAKKVTDGASAPISNGAIVRGVGTIITGVGSIIAIFGQDIVKYTNYNIRT